MRTESRRAGRQKYLAGGPFVLEEAEDTPVHPDPNIIKYLMIPPLLNMILVRRCCELRMLKGGRDPRGDVTGGEALLGTPSPFRRHFDTNVNSFITFRRKYYTCHTPTVAYIPLPY